MPTSLITSPTYTPGRPALSLNFSSTHHRPTSRFFPTSHPPTPSPTSLSSTTLEHALHELAVDIEAKGDYYTIMYANSPVFIEAAAQCGGVINAHVIKFEQDAKGSVWEGMGWRVMGSWREKRFAGNGVAEADGDEERVWQARKESVEEMEWVFGEYEKMEKEGRKKGEERVWWADFEGGGKGEEEEKKEEEEQDESEEWEVVEVEDEAMSWEVLSPEVLSLEQEFSMLPLDDEDRQLVSGWSGVAPADDAGDHDSEAESDRSAEEAEGAEAGEEDGSRLEEEDASETEGDDGASTEDKSEIEPEEATLVEIEHEDVDDGIGLEDGEEVSALERLVEICLLERAHADLL